MTRSEQEMQDDIKQLKGEWLHDPCWNIEDTEGFEAYRDELLAFRLATEAAQAAVWKATLEDKAEAIGCPLNTKLAEYVLRLEACIDRLNARLDRIEG